MPAAKVDFHRLARKDYEDGFDWYAARSAATAQRFKKAVDEAVRRIGDGPLSLPKLSGDYRWVRVTRFPYMIVFRLRQPNDVVVVAVAHTSRRSGYWRHRT
jgi:plasmid stabilization system protein ParE